MANYTSTHTGAVIDASVTKVSASGVTQADFTKLNAVTSSATELNLLDGVTSTTAEINILDGVTSTAAEINILDGATLSVTELNYLDGADSSITTLSLPDNTTITVFGASLIDDANASTARSTLNVDVAGTDNSTNVTLVTTSYDYLSLSGQAITLGQIDISDDTNLVGGTGITLTGDTLSTTDGDIVHDSLSGFVANEHIDHSTVTLTAGDGLSGGGDITTNRSFSINVDDASIEINSDTLRVKASGITNDMLGGSIANAKLSNSSVSYGGISLSLGGSDATPAFDLSDATSLPIIAGTTGTLTVARGGTGATTASGARTNLNVDVAGTDNSTDVTLVTTSHDYLSLSGQAVTLGQIDISDDTNLVGGTGITLTGDTLSTTDSEIVHDNLSGFVANEHIDHSGVSITAGAGLTGGGDITATRDIAVGAGTGVTVNADDIAIGQDVGTNADVTFNSVTSDDFIGSLNGAVQFEAKATVALNKGDAVYVVGISGNTPTIAIADSNDAAKMPSFGLAASSASINDVIEVVTFGTLKNINTSSFSEGDVLFISSNGTSGNTLTATKEAGESVLCQNIGKVIRSHATVGSIKVGGAGRANATPNLNDGNIFIGNGSNQAVTAALNTKIEEYLSAGTSTANFDTISIDGTEITATATELNKMDGVTSTTAEINYTDGVTSNIQTQLNLKAPLASPAFTGTATGANLTLSGDLTVNGSTTTLDTTNLAVEDNLMELNAGVTSNANDAGFLIERGSTGDNAIFMWDESADKFTLGTTTATGTTTGDITLSSTGTLVANVEGAITGDVTGNADTATALATARNFSLTGDVTAGAISFDGSGNVALATTIAANSVALGTDTTGNYMSDLTEGTGIDISHTPAEGSNGTITLDLTEVGFGGGANRLITDDGDGTVSTEANLTFDGTDLAIAATGKIYLDGGSHTYISEYSNDNLGFYVGGNLVATMTASQDLIVEDNITVKDGNKFIAGNGSDYEIYANADGATYHKNITQDADIRFQVNDGGSTITALKIDSSEVGSVLLPNDGQHLKLGVGGDLGFYVNADDSSVIRTWTSDKDLYFYVNDGGVATPAIQIDASDAGTAIFNQDIRLNTNATYIHSKDASGNTPRMFGINGSNTTYIGPIDSYAGGSILYGTSSNVTDHIFYTGGAERLRIKSDGKIGINGDTTDAFFRINSTSSQNGFKIIGSAARAASRYAIHIDDNDTNSRGSVRIDTASGPSLTTTGSVGIGTASPTDTLQVEGSIGVGVGRDGQLTSVNNGLAMRSLVSDADMYFYVNDGGVDTLAMKIDASDAGTAIFSHDILLNTNLGAIRFGASQQGNIYENGDDLVFSVQSAGQDMIFENLNSAGSAYVTNLFIDGSTERVGIGTTSPGYKLDVAGDYRFKDTASGGALLGYHHNDSDNGLLLLAYGSSYSGGSTLSVGANGTAYDHSHNVGIDAGSSSFIALGVGGSEKMRVHTDGKVGIGTASPAFGLQIDGADFSGDAFKITRGTSAFTILNANDSYGVLGMESNDDLQIRTNGTTRMTIDNAGLVGIGTTSPQVNLDVAGSGGTDGAAGSPTIRLSNTVQSADWDTGDVVGTIEYYAADSSGNAPYVTSFIKSVNGADGGNGTLPSGALTFGVASYNLSGGAVEKMRIDSTGNVGIGTNSPSKKLEVAGGFRISETGDSSDYLEIGVGTDATTGGTSVLTNNGSMVFGTTDSSSLIVRTNNTEAMRIDSSGNVGIGTTSPATTLEVDGILTMEDVTAPAEGVAGHAQMFSNSGEMKVNDASGNITTISPHNFELIPGGASEDMAFSYHSMKNTPEGKLKKVNVDMMKLARLVEELTGEKLVYIDEQ